MANKNKITNGGFTVIYAALFAGLMIAIGVSIYTIAIKELVLSSASRESQFSFYAADTGLECVQYWDFHGIQDVGFSVFATSTNAGEYPNIVDPMTAPNYTGKVFCNGVDLISASSDWKVLQLASLSGEKVTQTTFKIQFSPEPYCAVVDVIKTVSDPIGSPSTAFVEIKSHGYNTCVESDPQRVERGIQTTYTIN